MGFAVFGWLSAGYLYYRLLQLGAGPSYGRDACSALFGRGCDDALLSPYSLQLGVPLAGWGLVYFALLGLLLAVGTQLTIRAAALLAASGVGASLVMTWWLLSGRAPLCPICLLVHAVNLVLLATIWRPKPAEHGTTVAPSWVGALGLVLIAGFIYQSSATKRARIDPDRLLATYEATTPVELDLAAESAKAPARLVVFSSFQCPACRQASVAARDLQRQFGDDLAFVYVHHPLETECNPSMTVDLHPRSCEAAKAAEAARLQGAFWQFHDLLYESDLSATEEELERIATASGLDLERWQADRNAREVAARVAADVALGNRLVIQATPTLFLNGRRLPSPSLAVLKLLVGHELARG